MRKTSVKIMIKIGSKHLDPFFTFNNKKKKKSLTKSAVKISILIGWLLQTIYCKILTETSWSLGHSKI